MLFVWVVVRREVVKNLDCLYDFVQGFLGNGLDARGEQHSTALESLAEFIVLFRDGRRIEIFGHWKVVNYHQASQSRSSVQPIDFTT